MSRDGRLPTPEPRSIPSDDSLGDALEIPADELLADEGWERARDTSTPPPRPRLAVSNPSASVARQHGRPRLSTGTYAPGETSPYESEASRLPPPVLPARPADAPRGRLCVRLSVRGVLVATFGAFLTGVATTILIGRLMAPPYDPAEGYVSVPLEAMTAQPAAGSNAATPSSATSGAAATRR